MSRNRLMHTLIMLGWSIVSFYVLWAQDEPVEYQNLEASSRITANELDGQLVIDVTGIKSSMVDRLKRASSQTALETILRQIHGRLTRIDNIVVVRRWDRIYPWARGISIPLEGWIAWIKAVKFEQLKDLVEGKVILAREVTPEFAEAIMQFFGHTTVQWLYCKCWDAVCISLNVTPIVVVSYRDIKLPISVLSENSHQQPKNIRYPPTDEDIRGLWTPTSLTKEEIDALLSAHQQAKRVLRELKGLWPPKEVMNEPTVPEGATQVHISVSRIYQLVELCELVRQQTGIRMFCHPRLKEEEVFLSAGKYKLANMLNAVEIAKGLGHRLVKGRVFIVPRSLAILERWRRYLQNHELRSDERYQKARKLLSATIAPIARIIAKRSVYLEEYIAPWKIEMLTQPFSKPYAELNIPLRQWVEIAWRRRRNEKLASDATVTIAPKVTLSVGVFHPLSPATSHSFVAP